MQCPNSATDLEGDADEGPCGGESVVLADLLVEGVASTNSIA